METKVVNLVIKTGDANAAIKKTDASVKGFKKNTEDAGKSATKSIKGVDSAFNALPSSIQGAVGQVKNLGTSFKALAIGGAVGAIAGLGSLFVMATRKGAEFAKQMSTLKAVSGATTSEIDALASSAKNLGSTTQFTAVEVGELQTEFAKMGFSTKQILASTKATLDLAASMEVGLAEAATLAGSTVNAFGLEAEDTQRVVDVLAASTSESALDFSSLTEAFKNVSPAAAATNRSVEETSALLAVLANNGIKGSRAGTGLAKAFIDLNKKGIPLNEALDKIKNSSNSLNTAMELAGEVGGKALSVLANKRPQIEALTKSFENSAGAAKRMAEVRLDNLAGDTTKLSSAWEGFLLSIEDGEGLFSSIARGIVQATTSLLNFITPTEKLSESLEKERTSLFRVQAELGNVNTTQEERTSLVLELQKQYPNYLKNINAETVSNKDLNAAIQEINKSLINKILIQEREEEIQEQAQETADELNNVLEKEAKALEYTAKLRKKYSDLGIEIKATSPNEVLKELNEIQKRENKLRVEGNGQNKLKIDGLSKLSKEQNNLFFKIESLNSAEKDFQEEQEKGNSLIKAKNALMERLGITTDKTSEKTNENTNELDLNALATDEVVKKTKDLILLKQQELKLITDTEATTESELIVKNKKIAVINEEIKRLKSLGIEVEKVTKKKEKAKKVDEPDDQIELQRAEKQFQELQRIRNTAEEQELLELAQEYDKKFELANGNNILEQELQNEHLNRIEEIQNGYAVRRKEYDDNAREEERQAKLQAANDGLDMAANALNSIQSLGNAVFAHKMKNLEKGSKEEEAAARKQFKFNKALQLGMAVIDAGKAITSSLAMAPVAIGPVPNPAGIASLAFAITTSAAQIAMIAAQKYQPSKTTATTPTSPSGSTGGGGSPSSSGGGTSPSQPPSFNVVGVSGTNQIAGALSSQPPIQAFVVAGAVTNAQQLQNNTINQATF